MTKQFYRREFVCVYLTVTSYTQNLLSNGKCKGQLSLILYLTSKSKYDFSSTSKT